MAKLTWKTPHPETLRLDMPIPEVARERPPRSGRSGVSLGS